MAECQGMNCEWDGRVWERFDVRKIQSTFARTSVAEGAPSTDFGGKFGGKGVFTNGALLVIISKPPSADENG